MRVSTGQYRDLLLTYLRPQGRRVALLGALLLGVIGLQLAGPQFLRAFIDGALAGRPTEALLGAAGLFLGVAVLTQLATVAETYLAEGVGWTATNRLRADLALHCLRLDMDFHNARTPGELIERIDGDVAVLGNFFARFVVHVLGNVLLGVGVLALLWRVHPLVGGVLSVFAVGSLALLIRLRNVAVPARVAAREASAELFGFLEERLSGTEDVRSSGATEYVMRTSYIRARELLRREQRAMLLSVAVGNTTVLLFAVATTLSLALGAYLFLRDEVSIGTVYLIFTYTELLNRPIEQITRQMQELQQAGAGVARIGELLALQPAIRDGVGEDGEDADLPDGALAVRFDRVSFSYHDGTPVLNDVSFELERGQVLGLIGRTGSGKTTLTRLLSRLYEPQGGVVRLGGVDLRQTRLADVRERVGVVTQEIQLFHASVRNNLTLFDDAVPDGRILDALRELGLWGWYQGLPDGLDTLLPPGGGGVSAGEAQLLAFARVFLRDPGLVILDEASSRLDPSTERLVERAVDTLLEGRTAIVIAHRLATVQRADVILVLDHGRILEYGPRRELLADPSSRFAELLRTGAEEVLVG